MEHGKRMEESYYEIVFRVKSVFHPWLIIIWTKTNGFYGS
jgi:hypothetical protein